ncbi:MAG: DUF1801 domain-containing protein [Flavobacterium sp.]|uniref:DUF1801 domain-containing protein n=1 Tax=Flavobacterium sp. TaxID=239 RepID=UPI0012035BB1|nr:DUF1801 domain-containing protein [Flavobacterium sp.]RZJ65739.1 MAG: DUF1801 domain-containing protein [Flavobacterium sp.]
MAYETKTKATQVSVTDFISAVPDETKRSDSFKLVELYQKLTGFEPKMWGPTIIGFGSYHYKYASGHEGDAPLAGFSPRKDALTFYFEPVYDEKEDLLSKIGKHKVSKGCVYVKKLADIDMGILEQMIVASMNHTRKMYP